MDQGLHCHSKELRLYLAERGELRAEVGCRERGKKAGRPRNRAGGHGGPLWGSGGRDGEDGSGGGTQRRTGRTDRCSSIDSREHQRHQGAVGLGYWSQGTPRTRGNSSWRIDEFGLDSECETLSMQ